jgi:hypothetical protein
MSICRNARLMPQTRPLLVRGSTRRLRRPGIATAKGIAGSPATAVAAPLACVAAARRPQPGDQHQTIREHLPRHRDLGQLVSGSVAIEFSCSDASPKWKIAPNRLGIRGMSVSIPV